MDFALVVNCFVHLQEFFKLHVEIAWNSFKLGIYNYLSKQKSILWSIIGKGENFIKRWCYKTFAVHCLAKFAVVHRSTICSNLHTLPAAVLDACKKNTASTLFKKYARFVSKHNTLEVISKQNPTSWQDVASASVYCKHMKHHCKEPHP